MCKVERQLLLQVGEIYPPSRASNHPTRTAYLWPSPFQSWAESKLDSKRPPSQSIVMASLTQTLQLQNAQGLGWAWGNPNATCKGPTTKMHWMPFWYTHKKGFTSNRGKQQAHQGCNSPRWVHLHWLNDQHASWLYCPIKRQADMQKIQGHHHFRQPLLQTAIHPLPWNPVIRGVGSGKNHVLKIFCLSRRSNQAITCLQWLVQRQHFPLLLWEKPPTHQLLWCKCPFSKWNGPRTKHGSSCFTQKAGDLRPSILHFGHLRCKIKCICTTPCPLRMRTGHDLRNSQALMWAQDLLTTTILVALSMLCKMLSKENLLFQSGNLIANLRLTWVLPCFMCTMCTWS